MQPRLAKELLHCDPHAVKRDNSKKKENDNIMRRFSAGLINDDIVLENLDISKSQAILDAGCGNGHMTKKFSNLVGSTGKIYALDIDYGFIEALRNEIDIRRT